MFFKLPLRIYLVAVFATLMAIFWQEWNSALLDGDASRYGIIYTADEASYFAPARNFLDEGIWKANAIGNSSFYARTPGYGGVFLVLKFLFGSKVYLALKILQIAVSFLSILLFFNILKLWGIRQKLAFIGTLLYAVLPTYSGFMYYGLTEALTPFLLLWTIYSVSYSAFIKQANTLMISLSTGLLLLVRPQLIIFAFTPLVYSIIVKNKVLRNGVLIAFIPLCLWMVRTSFISKSFPSLHPIYSVTNNSTYRPSHAALTDLYRVWESDGVVFHKHVGLLSSNNDNSVAIVLRDIPESYKEKVRPVLSAYSKLRRIQRINYSNKLIFDYLPGERMFIELTASTRTLLISQDPATFYVKTPLKSAQHLLGSSHLNLYLFQAKLQGSVFGWSVKIISAVIVLMTLLLTFYQTIMQGHDIQRYLSIACLLYILYLIGVQRFNEHRYLVPLLPVFLIIAVNVINRMKYTRLKH